MTRRCNRVRRSAIDRVSGDVLLLAVDGRQRTSSGLTTVELAQVLRDLGAERALNLDGGGSTTMVARRDGGTTGVINSPSDGVERPIPDALLITYRAHRR